jgi:hypothetical protein
VAVRRPPSEIAEDRKDSRRFSPTASSSRLLVALRKGGTRRAQKALSTRDAECCCTGEPENDESQLSLGLETSRRFITGISFEWESAFPAKTAISLCVRHCRLSCCFGSERSGRHEPIEPETPRVEAFVRLDEVGMTFSATVTKLHHAAGPREFLGFAHGEDALPPGSHRGFCAHDLSPSGLTKST